MDAEQAFMTKLANMSLPAPAEDVPVQLLGRQAARRFLDGEEPTMTAAVTGIAKEARLGTEHARRVAESANQSVWASEFRGNGNRHVQFAPANPEEVLGALTEAPEDLGMPVYDYAFDPPGSTLQPEGDLWAAFGMTEPQQEKVASTKKVGWRDVERVEGTLERARSDVDRLTLAMAQTGEELYALVKTAYVHEGRGILQIGAAIAQACESEKFAHLLTRQLGARLEQEGRVRYSADQEKEKLAQVLVVDHEHPILAAARSLEAMSTLHYTRNQDLDSARAAHAEALRLYRQTGRP